MWGILAVILILTAAFAALFTVQPKTAEAYVDGIYNPNVDPRPTNEQLASIGYSIEQSSYRFYSDTPGTTVSVKLNNATINADYSEGYGITYGLFHTVNGVKYRCFVYTEKGSSINTQFVHVPSTDTTSKINYNSWRISQQSAANHLSIGNPAGSNNTEGGLMRVDQDNGRIYFTYWDLNEGKNISFYLGKNGLTEDINQTEAVTKKVTPPTGKTLTYNGYVQTGVDGGEGYTLSGTTQASAAGIYTAYATLQSGYAWSDGSTGVHTITWYIDRLSLANASVTVSSPTYNGSAQTPVPTVTVNGKTLVYGTDFTCQWSNNTNAGTATVTIYGAGNYSGTKPVNFTINKAQQPANAFSNASSVTYGSTLDLALNAAIEGGAKVTYTVTNGSGSATISGNKLTPTKPGTVTVTATIGATQNYEGKTITQTITIGAKDISGVTASVSGNFTYNGSAFTPKPVVKDGNKTLVENIDYRHPMKGCLPFVKREPPAMREGKGSGSVAKKNLQ